MLLKHKVRRKYNTIRKKKYFSVDKKYFKPLVNLIKRKNKKNIALYYPSNYEVDTFELFNLLEKEGGYSISLPIIINNKEMEFVKWKLFDPLKVNSFGFLEPIKKNKIVYPDLFLLPLLAFDKNNYRLGYGKGYYDKFLNKYLKLNKNIMTIGVAFSFQKYNKLPISKFDVKLDYILTEKGIKKQT